MNPHWVRRKDHNPTIKGQYLVKRANGNVEFVLYGTSTGWDGGRETREAKRDFNRRIIAWAYIDLPPTEWSDDWRLWDKTV
jgi:hypothetical protein